jgi:hypothetical protein
MNKRAKQQEDSWPGISRLAGICALLVALGFIPLSLRVGNALVAYVVYLGKLIWPSGLAIENSMAWMLAAGPQPSLRNGARAVQSATQASRAAGGSNPVILRTLAAAYALAGEFPDAIQTAQKALQLVQSNGALADTLEREVTLYEAGRPLPPAQR